ncbi:MAG: class I SAM-dependent methyltransferase, partial [Armatimonadetes bacterium]|nr:class I SAM-dependent methyltransferase [Armatimonadota bacterium]
MEDGYEYRGLLAATWDLLRGDTSQWEDRFFFRDLILDYGQPVLDV